MTLGLVGGGRIYLFAFSVLASLLLGLRSGTIALALNVGSIFFLGWLLNTGYFELSIETSHTAEQWVAALFSFSFLNTVITVSIGVLVSALERPIKP